MSLFGSMFGGRNKKAEEINWSNPNAAIQVSSAYDDKINRNSFNNNNMYSAMMVAWTVHAAGVSIYLRTAKVPISHSSAVRQSFLEDFLAFMGDDSGNLKEKYVDLLVIVDQKYIFDLTEGLTQTISDPDKRLRVVYDIASALILRYNINKYFNIKPV